MCNQCGRSYKHKTNLCNHKREECGKPPSYFCPICKKGFKKKQHLQRHVTVHNEINLGGPNFDKDVFKNVLPQQITNNSDFKTPMNPLKTQSKIEQNSSLPLVSIFPNQIIPLIYPNPVMRPAGISSDSFPVIPTSAIESRMSSPRNWNSETQLNQP